MLNHLSIITLINNDGRVPSPKMPRTPRIPLTSRKELTPLLEDEPFENLVASVPDRVEAVVRAQAGYTKY